MIVSGVVIDGIRFFKIPPLWGVIEDLHVVTCFKFFLWMFDPNKNELYILIHRGCLHMNMLWGWEPSSVLDTLILNILKSHNLSIYGAQQLVHGTSMYWSPPRSPLLVTIKPSKKRRYNSITTKTPILFLTRKNTTM